MVLTLALALAKLGVSNVIPRQVIQTTMFQWDEYNFKHILNDFKVLHIHSFSKTIWKTINVYYWSKYVQDGMLYGKLKQFTAAM